jgi:hypothetical protein
LLFSEGNGPHLAIVSANNGAVNSINIEWTPLRADNLYGSKTPLF